ncbi:tripartite tricarboxylate transporter TctB family protein [Geminicoccus roseus]|uniref:tripartite tricarboxylate transporter TctB family protein n=1 Tax=Geminicoccus roseus TaxID=404900 RepID=UPI000424C0DF|nr:tripartite tricarboxylate transporter TctB family protein [Geminicoccus roseus]
MDHEHQGSGRELMALGLATLAGGLALAIGTASLPAPASYAGVGARLFPGLASAGLILVGLWLAAQGWRARHVQGDGEPVDPMAAAAIIAGLVAHMMLIETAGFVVASTVLFFAVTLAFRDRRWWFNLAVAAALAILTRIALGYGLGLNLPTLLPGGLI